MLVNFTEAITHEPGSKTTPITSRVSLDRVAVIILGGGEGKRLHPLTKARCKPAISFGGRYSLIDVPISHSLSTGLSQIFVIGQYLAHTLQKHLFQTYFYQGILQNQIQLLIPEEREGKKVWYKGTADAIRQNLDFFAEIPADYFLILSGDQLYNINFQAMINFGLETDAGMLIAVQPVNAKDAKRMGILKLEHESSKIVDFVEKPQEDEILEKFFTDKETLEKLGYEHKGKHYLGSMGIYFFKRQTMFDLLRADTREDFGKHLIKSQMKNQDVHAYLYDGYWEDIGTIESYFQANLALTRHGDDRKMGLQCYDEKERIITKHYYLPGAKISNCKITQALICEGSVIEASEITNCVIGVRSVIEEGCTLKNTILIGNEYYERPPIKAGEGSLRPRIGKNCHIEKTIIDENVIIGDNVTLVNHKNHQEFETADGLLIVRDGIIVVPRGTHIPDGYVF